MNELALFAGVGGGCLATQWLLGWRTVCYVENNQYCVSILKQRITDGMLNDAPIWDDVTTFDGMPWRGCVDIISAGFPCQPWSSAGKRLGRNDERNMWPDTIRIVRQIEPEWILLENVTRLLSGSHGYFGQILKDLATGGYDARWECVPASVIGAPHIRDRVWIVAHATSEGGFNVPIRSRRQNKAAIDFVRSSQTVADTKYNAVLHNEYNDKGNANANWNRGGTWWATEPDVGRVADGVAARVDRLKAIGNGQVPAVVAAAWDLMVDRC